ncbi:MAG TPA: autoinducer binding domain-containing protein [Noviherbaspirillum sp.]|uniref:autoinducer binding domain-containing protein n=1 Tax=Noviherbaspirillum sp. TaxID=1926288 RepID=UPI002D270DC0|nr:autoinducer binding domain-containing protein [Noviherbaspirillum sp.]HYD94469.1 autoinducer binding domain-containing protein [Noviherbaspirillum sp.]
MEAWQEDRFDALLKIDSEQDAFDQLAGVARAMGFEYCAYGMRMPIPISRPRLVMFNNYSPQWQQCYQAREYLRVDPTVKHALKSTLPVVWSNHLFESARDMWEEARCHGLRYGWAQSSRDAGGVVGLLTLARGAEALSPAELAENQPKMSWLAQYAHAAMTRILVPRLTPETLAPITAREKEVLRWTAEGKTAYEIACILSIAERTVNFHINNAVAKLGATNKTQAAVKAAALGLLS